MRGGRHVGDRSQYMVSAHPAGLYSGDLFRHGRDHGLVVHEHIPCNTVCADHQEIFLEVMACIGTACTLVIIC